MKVPTMIAQMVRQEGGAIESDGRGGGIWWQHGLTHKRGEWSKQPDGSYKLDLHPPTLRSPAGLPITLDTESPNQICRNLDERR